MKPFARILGLAVCVDESPAQKAGIDGYLQPYGRSGNFSGQVLVERNGKVVFEKAYGFADRERGVRKSAAMRLLRPLFCGL